MFTAYHAKYFAHDLTRRRASNDDERLTQSLFDASVDLNPHQIEAALFASKSPLSKEPQPRLPNRPPIRRMNLLTAGLPNGLSHRLSTRNKLPQGFTLILTAPD